MSARRLLSPLALVAAAAACSHDLPSAPAGRVPNGPSLQGGVTDPAVLLPGVAGTWKGTLTAAYLPTGTARWEFKVTPLTDTSFYATAREIVPQTDGSSFTMSGITAYGKNVGSSVTMRVYIANAADFVGTLSPDGTALTGAWTYCVMPGCTTQQLGTLALAR